MLSLAPLAEPQGEALGRSAFDGWGPERFFVQMAQMSS
jgi:hypothetical protein